MTHYRLLNNLFGWTAFFIALTTYLLTMEPTVSFWDCGEFIASAYHLQIGHQPGAPLFIMIGKVFSLLASQPEYVAMTVNSVSALASSFTILFLFWTITAMALKLSEIASSEMTRHRFILIFGAGFVGALAYTFSDTFWFSAVEAEVYALSSFSTALVFWAILKWESSADKPVADRWLVFISFVIGLSIGLHLLNLLAIPAIVLVYYYKRSTAVTIKGALVTFLSGCTLVGIVQFGIIQYLVYYAAQTDILFVNSFKLPFGSGAIFFLLAIFGLIGYGTYYSIKNSKYNLNLGLLCLIFLLFGYSSYFMTIERAQAKTAINISNPDNPVALFGYLGREGYSQSPLLYGQYFDAEYIGTKGGKTKYRKGENSYEVERVDYQREYNRNTIFPRIWSDEPNHQQFYRNWLGIPEGMKADFTDNIRFFTSYQVGFMYWRYFFWNFAGRQNDLQGQGGTKEGNWLTGIKPLDQLRLDNQENLPKSITANEGYNRFFALPLLLGIAGLCYQFRKNKKQFMVMATLFFCTGLAIVFYLNQNPLQVRERDYVFAGSFYAFSIWIGLGVPAAWSLLRKNKYHSLSAAMVSAVCIVLVPFIMARQGWDDHDRSDKYTAREMAANTLNSCAENAILFTNADNDTYPLWYAQQVEGIRPDVRIVNMQLLYVDNYIDALKKELIRSAPLPVTMEKSQYVQGVRDVLPFVNYGIIDSVELKDVFDVMLSDNPNDKIEMQDGSKENFLPTKNLHITVDPAQVIRTGTIPQSRKSQIAKEIVWNFNKNYVTKADLAAFDILAHNNWERPIYFSAGVSSDTYMGLDRYLYREGYAYRLLPLKREKNDKRDKLEMTNSDVMYTNLMNRFELGGFRKANYLDPESRRVGNTTWDAFNTLASNLIDERKQENARKIIHKALDVLPQKDYTVADTANKFSAAMNLYRLNEINQANGQIRKAVEFLASEVSYLTAIKNRTKEKSADLQMASAYLNEFRKLAYEYKQTKVLNEINLVMRNIEG